MIGTMDVAPIVVILSMMGILLILGLFMDWVGIALLTMPDLRAHRRQTGVRSGVVRHPVRDEHAGLLHLAAVRARRVLPEGRGAA